LYPIFSFIFFSLIQKIKAAKEIGVCTTTLKNVCRKRGIPRWPYRKITCLDRKISELQSSFIMDNFSTFPSLTNSLMIHHQTPKETNIISESSSQQSSDEFSKSPTSFDLQPISISTPLSDPVTPNPRLIEMLEKSLLNLCRETMNEAANEYGRKHFSKKSMEIKDYVPFLVELRPKNYFTPEKSSPSHFKKESHHPFFNDILFFQSPQNPPKKKRRVEAEF
jgi:hypothetical protein